MAGHDPAGSRPLSAPHVDAVLNLLAKVATAIPPPRPGAPATRPPAPRFLLATLDLRTAAGAAAGLRRAGVLVVNSPGAAPAVFDTRPFPAAAVVDAAKSPDPLPRLAASVPGGDDAVYRRLAERANVPFDPLSAGAQVRDPHRLRAAATGRLAAAVIKRKGQADRMVLAPPASRLEATLADGSRHPGLAVTTPRRLEACLRRAVAYREIRAALDRLHRQEPALSARHCPSLRVRLAIRGTVILVPLLAFTAGFPLVLSLLALTSLALLAVTAIRLQAVVARPGLDRGRGLPDGALPRYTVLVPLRHEAAMVPGLMRRLEALDYPRDRLEVRFLVEADDRQTAAALHRACRRPDFRVITVPAGPLATKPRALVYGLAFTTGELVTVFDAEDRPEPDQLRKAAAALLGGPDHLACVQARLEIDRPQGPIARQFAIEYAALFGGVLPFLAAARLPLPLGGTSNHFKRLALDDTGGWDPYNVTEDADLGARLARFGYTTGMLDSVTFEDAPERWAVWHRQRVRWLKGWLMTWIVHSRRPRAAAREMGWRNMLFLQLYAAATILAPLLHPIGLMLLAATAAGVLAAPGAGAFWSDVLTAAALWSAAFSYLASVLAAVRTLRAQGRSDLVPHAVLTPVYWLLISWAAWCAVGDLLRRPHHWSKTPHEPAIDDR